MTERNQLGDELTGDLALIVAAARIIQKGITTRSEGDALSVLQRRLDVDKRMDAMEQSLQQKDNELQRLQFESKRLSDEGKALERGCAAALDDLESRYCIESDYAGERHPVVEAMERMQAALLAATQKLDRVRVVVTHDKPLQGERPGTPRFVVSGRDVLRAMGENV